MRITVLCVGVRGGQTNLDQFQVFDDSVEAESYFISLIPDNVSNPEVVEDALMCGYYEYMDGGLAVIRHD